MFAWTGVHKLFYSGPCWAVLVFFFLPRLDSPAALLWVIMQQEYQRHKYLSGISTQGIYFLCMAGTEVLMRSPKGSAAQHWSPGMLCDAVCCGHALSRVHQGSILCSTQLLPPSYSPCSMCLLSISWLIFFVLIFSVSEYVPLGSGGRQQQGQADPDRCELETAAAARHSCHSGHL